MKTNWIHKLILGLLVIFTVTGCEFFTNDPGLVNPNVEDGVDLSISNVRAPVSALVGDDVPIQVVLENSSSSAITQEITITAIHQQGDSVLSEMVLSEGIAADSAVALTIRWNTIASEQGTHTIVIKHNLEDQNPSNNSRLINLTLTEQQDFDLAISTMSVPSEVVRGEDAEIHVTLVNVGSEEIEESVNLFLFRDSEENLIEDQSLETSIPSGESLSFTFIWETENVPPGDYEIIAFHDFEDNTPQNNQGTLDISILEGDSADEPDLAITAIDAPSEADQGDDVQVIATILNNGNDLIEENVEFVLKNETSEQVIDVISFDDDLNIGESSNLTFTWNTDEIDGGEYTLSVSHDFEDNSPNNNSRSATVEIDESLLFDVAITNFSGPSDLSRGEEVGLNFTISNTGQTPLSDEEIRIEVSDLTDGRLIDRRNFNDDLDIGESQDFEISWETDEATIGEHSLRVSQRLNDDDENNNNRDLVLLITESEQNFSVEEFDPDELEKNEEEEIRISGTGFVEGIRVDFFRNEGKGDDDDDDDDDDDNENDNTPEPTILGTEYVDENTMIIRVRTWWWGRNNVNWNARLTHPNGEVIEVKDALRVKD